MTYLFQPPPVPMVPILGMSETFPVHRIYCVGQNYSAHVREMGGDPAQLKQGAPVFFSKPADAVVTDNEPVTYPSATADLHHEVELVLALSAGGMDIPPEQALELIFGFAVGIDFTRRDLQAVAKQAGRPWDVAKGFDQSAPISTIQPRAACDLTNGAEIWLRVNGEMRQQANIQDMIWSSAEIIAQLSQFYCLQAGDLVFTGTPEGVSAVRPGDSLTAGIEGVGELALDLLPPRSGA